MIDNGLLKYYRTCYYREGFLNSKHIRLKENMSSLFDSTVKCSSIEGSYYKKFGHYFSKEMADAEILLSQIYAKAGLNSAIYVPVENDGKRFVVSDAIDTESNVSASLYHNQIKKDFSADKIIPIFNSEGKDIVKYFSNQALLKQIQMRTFDLASINNDRQSCNYFYKLNEEGKADDVVVFDFERSGLIANGYLKFNNMSQNELYPNDFSNKDMSKAEVIDCLKNNEEVNKIISPTELAEQVGSVDVKQVATDILRTTGYGVEPKYVDYLSRSFNEVANDLAK